MSVTGRPTKYGQLDYLHVIQVLCELGHTDEEIAKVLNVSVSTVDNYKKEHPDFLGAIKDGKSVADARVKMALYSRCIGYDCKETKVYAHEGIVTDTKDIIKHYPPDVAAAFIWLKNRCSDEFRDKVQQEHSGGTTLTVVSETVEK